ncbi:MAG: hypothetical protein SCM96_02650 [Acidobacteriota bacterium]|nr:hypothetical protein [Acidobacteriota bacterium]
MIFGPGEIRSAHAPDEFVPIAELATAVLRFCRSRAAGRRASAALRLSLFARLFSQSGDIVGRAIPFLEEALRGKESAAGS